ncbi:MAG: heavy metal translocating P-type ATPase [Chloroflexota bacterium]
MTNFFLSTFFKRTAVFATFRPYKSTRLVDTLLTTPNHKSTTKLQPKPPSMLAQTQQFVGELFGDTRTQYQKSLNANHDNSAQLAIERKTKRQFLASLIALGLATAGVLVSPVFYIPTLACLFYASRMVCQNAYHTVVNERRFDHHVLMVLVIIGTWVAGFIWAAAFSATFGILNRLLVVKTESRSQQSIANLFGGQIQTVWLLVDGVEVEILFEQVQVGDVVVVHAGQMIPVDGTIVEGSVTIDQHMLTGESQPVEKSIGDTVLASTVVLSGRLAVHVDKAGEETVAAQITEMLNQTTDFKQAIQSRTDRWLNRTLLPLFSLSALAFPLWGVEGALSVLWYHPGYRMTLLGPLSMLSFLQVAAQKGVLVKDGRALEVLYEVDMVVFDKTGTLTLEQPTVSQVYVCHTQKPKISADALLRYAAAAESKQSHPIARAILQAANDRQLVLPTLDDAQYKVGYGLKTQIDGHVILVGSIRFMAMEGISVPDDIKTRQTESHLNGHSLVLVAFDNQMAGAVELVPTIRPEVTALINDLHGRDIKTVIISGDNEAPTRTLANSLGINRYFAEVLPEEKARLVEQLQQEGHKVCFVGDGINDSIALKKADVSVSLRGATSIATDTAQIVFMDGTLNQLSTLFDLADDFAANMRVNLWASVAPGVLGIACTLLFGLGLTTGVILYQVVTPVGVYNALKPLMDERKEGRRLNAARTHKTLSPHHAYSQP